MRKTERRRYARTLSVALERQVGRDRVQAPPFFRQIIQILSVVTTGVQSLPPDGREPNPPGLPY